MGKIQDKSFHISGNAFSKEIYNEMVAKFTMISTVAATSKSRKSFVAKMRSHNMRTGGEDDYKTEMQKLQEQQQE